PRALIPPLLPSFPTRRSSDLIRASLAHSTSNNATIERRRALDAITADPEGTLQALDDLAFRRGTLPHLLKRAQKRIRLLLLQRLDRKSTRLNSSHVSISYAVF